MPSIFRKHNYRPITSKLFRVPLTVLIVTISAVIILLFYYRHQSVEYSSKKTSQDVGESIENRTDPNQKSVLFSFNKTEDVIKNRKDPNLESEKNVLPQIPHADDAILVLVIACNRITVARCLDQILKYRPSKVRFPVLVSQDCGHQQTSEVIDSYEEVYHIHHPDLSNITVRPSHSAYQGYYKIARHYKWALNVTFYHYNFTNAIVIEDDLDLAPDIFEYFTATLPILKADPTLWCVSAYNDNGRPGLIDERAVDLLYRTDFFPGLGWMLTKSLWTELSSTWPATFWDDWMREPKQRKDRSCIRPEISRTKTFGKVGVSGGLFYEEYLETIILNKVFFNFIDKDMSYLMKDVYDRDFLNTVRSSPSISVSQLEEDGISAGDNPSVRIQYEKNNQQELVKLLKNFSLMSDIRSGVPRTAYLDILTFVYGKRRVYLSPNNDSNFNFQV